MIELNIWVIVLKHLPNGSLYYFPFSLYTLKAKRGTFFWSICLFFDYFTSFVLNSRIRSFILDLNITVFVYFILHLIENMGKCGSCLVNDYRRLWRFPYNVWMILLIRPFQIWFYGLLITCNRRSHLHSNLLNILGRIDSLLYLGISFSSLVAIE